MIKTEQILINNHYFKKTYSTEGFYIIQKETGNKYTEAVDSISNNYTYTETTEKIPKEEGVN